MTLMESYICGEVRVYLESISQSEPPLSSEDLSTQFVPPRTGGKTGVEGLRVLNFFLVLSLGGWSLYFIFSISSELGMAIGGFLCFATFIRMATSILSLSDLRLTPCQRLSYESVLFMPWHLQGGCSWRNLLRWGGSWTGQVLLLFTNSIVTLGLIVWHLVAYWGAKDSHSMLF